MFSKSLLNICRYAVPALALLIFPVNASAEQFEIWTEHPDIIYRFHEHLVEAETVVLRKGRDPVAGKWRNGRFYFSGLVPSAQVKLVQEQHGIEKGEAIQFNPIEKALRRLVFPEVPPGSRMDFYYKVARSGSKKEPSPYLFLKIFAGRHLIKSMRVFGDDEHWEKDVIDLGVVSLLRRSIVVTFEISADLLEELPFSFYALIKQ